MKKILVIAPHADDEILGCGATMAKEIAAGNHVYVLICTNAHVGAPELFSEELIKQIRSEAITAHKLLGVKETAFLDFPAPALDQYPRFKMSNEMSVIIRKFEVDTVYIPHRGDCHKDHAIVHDCAMVACRPLANCKVKRVYAYETLSETEWGEPIAAEYFVPVKYNTFTVEEFRKKLDAMSCFKSQLYPFPASRSLEAIEHLASYRGCTVSALRAEAFEVLRDID
ncbi:PIG-L deacetylase family protein [Bacteroides ovatus]|uniref:PIG-L deacetylase family protein n=1 Tax=Bacteroides ovatus TaxID=28116 RepID=UPI0018C948E5|nr:PIG-L deacetylase family protein [Bacteroides ovatus]MBG9220341.1 PIG-L family deacetylase [Bacteroides ovatus]MBG9233461.1 PIG-L family deacetylase [Bacteroides ovatus]